jgi:tRNA nucleotidyltransferase (CCA-adding enzyme)
MREDRLRALRAIRFAGRFDFEIEPATWRAIADSAPHLGRLSMERVKQELEKVMEQVALPARTLERYRQAGILAALMPVIADAPVARFAALDFLARPGLARRPDRRMLRLAALFVEPGESPPATLERDLKQLKFSNVEVRATLTLAQGAAAVSLERLRGLAAHAATAHAAATHAPHAHAPHVTDAASIELRRLVARVGRLMVPGLTRLLWARAKAEGLPAADGLRGVALYRAALRSARRDPLTIGDLAVDGDDLRSAGVPAGKAMGDTLHRLLELVITDPALNTREALLAEVRRGA